MVAFTGACWSYQPMQQRRLSTAPSSRVWAVQHRSGAVRVAFRAALVCLAARRGRLWTGWAGTGQPIALRAGADGRAVSSSDASAAGGPLSLTAPVRPFSPGGAPGWADDSPPSCWQTGCRLRSGVLRRLD